MRLKKIEVFLLFFLCFFGESAPSFSEESFFARVTDDDGVIVYASGDPQDNPDLQYAEVSDEDGDVVYSYGDIAPQAGSVSQGDMSEDLAKDGLLNVWLYNFLKGVLGGVDEIKVNEAEDASEGQVRAIDVEGSVVWALNNNNELKAAVENSNSHFWDKMGAYGQYLPTMDLNLSVGHERSRPASYNNSNGDRVANDRHLRKDRALLVKQPLFDLMVLSDILSATAKEDVSQYELLETRDKVATDTVKSFLKLLQSRIFIELSKEYMESLSVLVGVMQSRVAAGGAVSADLDRITSREGIVKSLIVEAEAEYAVSISEFKQLTGQVPSSLRVPEIVVPVVPKTLQEAMDQAFHKNPSYLASIKKVDLAKADRNKSASGVVPKVYAQLSREYTYNAGGSAAGNPVDGVYPSQRTDKAVVVAQWSIYGGTSVAGAMSGMAKQKQMTLLSEDMRDKIEQALTMNYTAVTSAQERIEVLKASVEANERMVVGFEEQFKAGTRSLFELLDAHEQLYNARTNLVRAVFAYAQASYQILNQTGDVTNVLSAQGQGD